MHWLCHQREPQLHTLWVCDSVQTLSSKHWATLSFSYLISRVGMLPTSFWVILRIKEKMNVKHLKPQQYPIIVSFLTQKSKPQNSEITPILSTRPYHHWQKYKSELDIDWSLCGSINLPSKLQIWSLSSAQKLSPQILAYIALLFTQVSTQIRRKWGKASWARIS